MQTKRNSLNHRKFEAGYLLFMLPIYLITKLVFCYWHTERLPSNLTFSDFGELLGTMHTLAEGIGVITFTTLLSFLLIRYVLMDSLPAEKKQYAHLNDTVELIREKKKECEDMIKHAQSTEAKERIQKDIDIYENDLKTITRQIESLEKE
jgi:hypothetical protein